MTAALIVLLVIVSIALVESARNTKHAIDLLEMMVLDEEGDDLLDEQPTDEFDAKAVAAKVAADRRRRR